MKKEYKFDEIKVIVISSKGYYGTGSFYDGIDINVYEGEKEIESRILHFGYGKDPGKWAIYDPSMMRDERVSLGQYINTRIAGCKRDCSPEKLEISCNMEGKSLTVKAKYSVRHVQVGYELCAQVSEFWDSLEIELPE